MSSRLVLNDSLQDYAFTYSELFWSKTLGFRKSHLRSFLAEADHLVRGLGNTVQLTTFKFYTVLFIFSVQSVPQSF